MSSWTKVIVAGLFAGLLTGCTWIEVADVERQSATGTAFDRALFNGYQELLVAEYEEYDLIDEHRFADRARLAAMGKTVEPEQISFRDLSEADAAELTAARARLMAVLEGGGKEKAPEASARAQVMFDCWMQEAEEMDIDAEACQTAFEAAIAEAEAALAPPPEPELPPLPQPISIYFDSGSDALSAEATAKLDGVIAGWEAAQAKTLVLEGHTDRAGSAEFNQALAERRADAVALYLMSNGFPARDINIRVLGEEEPAVSTPDGASEAANRRVLVLHTR